MEYEAANLEINISTPITEEQMEKLSSNVVTTATTKTLNVPLYGGEKTYYCGPATAKMIAKYYGVSHTQDYIYGIMGATAPQGTTIDQQLTYYRSSQGLAKTNSVKRTSSLYFGDVVTEINNNRPFRSGVSGHARACVGYYYDTGEQILALNDPSPQWSGSYQLEAFGSEINRIYVRS